MKLYTKSGDDGTTGLFGGSRVSKTHPRVEAYGTVDELNATLGVAAAACGDTSDLARRMGQMLTTLQSRLFDVGADLATPEDSPQSGKIHRIEDRHVQEVERWIDEIDADNPPLHTFVLPGGSEAAARLHLARSVCRRAERRIITLAAGEPVNAATPVFLNRVGDLLFAMARAANRDTGVSDVPWAADEG